MAWRVDVAADGNLFSLGVRNDAGREYEVLLGTVDSTPILSDLLSEMARVHRSLPPRTFAEGAGPRHPKSLPLQPLSTHIQQHDGVPVLVLDFGGTVLKVRIDPDELQRSLAASGAGA
ncbi:hypothetical protein [Microvirga sp. 2TAF3]|uniref:hypothetical protein n=1 Tax=Microvirga sp. 2TAF3 TaxID=3233014 RepID=UPI003F94BCA8